MPPKAARAQAPIAARRHRLKDAAQVAFRTVVLAEDAVRARRHKRATLTQRRSPRLEHRREHRTAHATRDTRDERLKCHDVASARTAENRVPYASRARSRRCDVAGCAPTSAQLLLTLATHTRMQTAAGARRCFAKDEQSRGTGSHAIGEQKSRYC
eukprot:1389597-Pleurochrysis_carterae.AAC.1